MNKSFLEGLCRILAPDAVVSVKTDDKDLFEDMDALLSTRLEPSPTAAVPPRATRILTEWENECKIKSLPIYSGEYRLRRRLPQKAL